MRDLILALYQVGVISAVVGCFGAAACAFFNDR